MRSWRRNAVDQIIVFEASCWGHQQGMCVSMWHWRVLVVQYVFLSFFYHHYQFRQKKQCETRDCTAEWPDNVTSKSHERRIDESSSFLTEGSRNIKMYVTTYLKPGCYTSCCKWPSCSSHLHTLSCSALPSRSLAWDRPLSCDVSWYLSGQTQRPSVLTPACTLYCPL